MKNLILLLFLLNLVLNCSKQNDNSENKVLLDSYYSKILLPNNFKIDSVKTFDEKTNTKTFIYLPVSDNAKINSEIDKEIEIRKKSFFKKVEDNIKEGFYNELGSEFIVTPISVFVDNNLYSYCFMIDFYINPAPHGKTEFYTFNYDISKNKELKFNDFFNIKTAEDSANFKNQITNQINKKGIQLNEIYDLKFNLKKDSIYFNFDNYEIASYAEGIIRAKFKKDELSRFIIN